MMRTVQLLLPSAAMLLSGCNVSIEHAASTMYFKTATLADVAKPCSEKPDGNWYTLNFSYENLDHRLVSPQGVICTQDREGKLIGGYLSASNAVATHQLTEGERWFVFPFSSFEAIAR
ncbi:MAG: hypothetical protein ABL928_07600 [Sphingorhabdus sp.]